MIRPVNYDPKILFSAWTKHQKHEHKIEEADLVKLLSWCKELYEARIQTTKILKLVT